MRVEVKAQALLRKLHRLAEDTQGQVLAEATVAGAEVIRQEASRRAPRRTHGLAKSIVAEVIEQTPTKVTVAIGPDKKRFYGLFIEVGTSRAPARPFLRPALDEGAEAAKKAVAAELKAAIDRAARR